MMKSLLNRALLEVDSAELYVREVASTSVVLSQGEIKEIASEAKLEVSLRVVKEGNMGTAVGTSLEDDTLIERALISLKHQISEAAEFPNGEIAEVQGPCERVKAMTTEELVKYAQDLDQRIKEKAPNITVSVALTKVYKKVSMLNSTGFDHSYEQTQVRLGAGTQTPQGFYGAGLSYALATLPNISDADIEGMLFEHGLSEKPITLSTERMPVIFDGSVMGALMMRVLGGVHGGNVLKGISPLQGRLGETLFSPLLTIRDDGTRPLGYNTRPFDDEGSKSQNTVLIEKGVLKSYLMSAGQAAKMGPTATATGNATKRALFSQEIEDAPSVFETNMIVEGDMIDDAEVFSRVARGLYITGVMGAHTGNINGGEFSLNISSGYLIEDGKLVGKVQGAMIAGNIYDLFKNIVAIGNTQKTMYSIFYPMGLSPMVLISEANIVG